LGQQTHIELNKLNDNSEDIVNVLKKHTSLILFQIKKILAGVMIYAEKR
jgi:hypothetical protein